MIMALKSSQIRYVLSEDLGGKHSISVEVGKNAYERLPELKDLSELDLAQQAKKLGRQGLAAIGERAPGKSISSSLTGLSEHLGKPGEGAALKELSEHITGISVTVDGIPAKLYDRGVRKGKRKVTVTRTVSMDGPYGLKAPPSTKMFDKPVEVEYRGQNYFDDAVQIHFLSKRGNTKYDVYGDPLDIDKVRLEKKVAQGYGQLPWEPGEQEKAKKLAVHMGRMAAAEYSRTGKPHKLAGIPVAEWEKEFDAAIRHVYPKWAKQNMGDRSGPILEKWKDITMRDFVNADDTRGPVKDIFPSKEVFGDVHTEDDYKDKLATCGMRMLMQVQDRVHRNLFGTNSVMIFHFSMNALKKMSAKMD